MGNSIKKTSNTIKNISNVHNAPQTDDITVRCMPNIFTFTRKKSDKKHQHLCEITDVFKTEIASIDTKYNIEPEQIMDNTLPIIKPNANILKIGTKIEATKTMTAIPSCLFRINVIMPE